MIFVYLGILTVLLIYAVARAIRAPRIRAERRNQILEDWRCWVVEHSYAEILAKEQEIRSQKNDAENSSEVLSILDTALSTLPHLIFPLDFRLANTGRFRFCSEKLLKGECFIAEQGEIFDEPLFVCDETARFLGIQIAQRLIICAPINLPRTADACNTIATLNGRRLLNSKDVELLSSVYDKVNAMFKEIGLEGLEQYPYWIDDNSPLAMRTLEMWGVNLKNGKKCTDGANNWDDPCYFICKF